MATGNKAQKTTIDPEEIKHFSKDSSRWWDDGGPFAPLHRLNPVRLRYIREQICAHYGRDETSLKPFGGLEILDIGCGGGLVCEPLARLGARVTGADADENAIAAARSHAAQSGLEIDYRCAEAGTLGKKFDVVLALEIAEHVADLEAFMQDCAALAKPGGLIIFSTLNRTAKSFALGIVAAEYILRWVPRRTHSWKKFIKPSELAHYARKCGLEPKDMAGLVFDPLKNEFALSGTDVDMNYLMSFRA